jgi:hypothetical protein
MSALYVLYMTVWYRPQGAATRVKVRTVGHEQVPDIWQAGVRYLPGMTRLELTELP